MVASDDHGRCDGELCPGCRFIEALIQHLDAAANGDDQRWQDATGDIVDAMHGALWALHRMRAEATTTYCDEVDSAGEAAMAFMALGTALNDLWRGLVDDDGQGDE